LVGLQEDYRSNSLAQDTPVSTLPKPQSSNNPPSFESNLTPSTSTETITNTTQNKEIVSSEVENEGVVGWVKRRLSFKSDPQTQNIIPPSTLPSSRRSFSEPPPPIHVNSSNNENKLEVTNGEQVENEGVIGWVKRRLSFKGDPGVNVDQPPPSTLPGSAPKRPSSVSRIFAVEWNDDDVVVDNPPPPKVEPSPLPPLRKENSYTDVDIHFDSDRMSDSSSHSIMSAPEMGNYQNEKKQKKSRFGWFSKKSTESSSTSEKSTQSTLSPSTTSTSNSSSSLTSSSSSTTTTSVQSPSSSINTNQSSLPRKNSSPEQPEDSVRKSLTRPSVKTLAESKKVGFMRGLFEGFSSKKDNTNNSSTSSSVTSSSATTDNNQKNNDSKDSRKTVVNNASIIVDDKRDMYLSIKPEPSIGTDPKTGRILYSYNELVRRNYLKEFDTVDHQDLEEHLSDGEFLIRFNMTKEEFRRLPKWRRTERKKNLMLF